MTELVYEQPLNEKIRGYLRLEHLDNQLRDNLNQDHQQRGFYPLFSLCELLERCDYRSDVLKDIERTLPILPVAEAKAPDSAEPLDLDALRSSLLQAREILQKTTRIGADLKQDRFLSALRQRFAMPGACCNFDLPQLHFWLAKPWEERQQHYREWTSQFTPLLTPISLLLQLTRSRSQFTPAIAQAGFFQGDSQQALSLVRVKINAAHGCYPTISGHKNRYAIHFAQFDRQRHTDKAIDFLLATCA